MAEENPGPAPQSWPPPSTGITQQADPSVADTALEDHHDLLIDVSTNSSIKVGIDRLPQELTVHRKDSAKTTPRMALPSLLQVTH